MRDFKEGMRIGIIGPSKLNENSREIISSLSKIVAESKNEIVVTPDKGSASEFFAQEYIKNGGIKIFEIVPLDDEEFGYDYLNLDLGEKINCGTWRNQPEKFNEETDVLLCVGYAVGVLLEMAYSKWFKPKPVFIVEELVSCKLSEEISLDLRYVSASSLEEELKSSGD